MDQKFKVKGDYIELTKLLKVTGLCGTGGHAKMVIENRLITVDGEVEIRKGRKIRKGMIVQYANDIVKVI
ncbi:MAG: RNA-binding S4 domain-containing protein [Candidatus Omnitrophica bacterium]|nr:RNA-binding S4 domain-containing protein [Candidatus Omnitrophota bacterium]